MAREYLECVRRKGINRDKLAGGWLTVPLILIWDSLSFVLF